MFINKFLQRYLLDFNHFSLFNTLLLTQNHVGLENQSHSIKYMNYLFSGICIISLLLSYKNHAFIFNNV